VQVILISLFEGENERSVAGGLGIGVVGRHLPWRVILLLWLIVAMGMWGL
jgi:hypothetical protein